MGNQSLLTKWLAAAVGSGLIAFMAAFVPSPLRVFDVFDSVPKIEVREPPKLALKEMPAAGSYAEIAARPIFNADRKPDPETREVVAAPAAGSADNDLSGYRVVGIVADSSTQRAIVERQGSPTLHLAPGDTLAGWRVSKIDAMGLTLNKDGRSVQLAIPKTKPGTPTP